MSTKTWYVTQSDSGCGQWHDSGFLRAGGPGFVVYDTPEQAHEAADVLRRFAAEEEPRIPIKFRVLKRTEEVCTPTITEAAPEGVEG